ncbi:MAG TPA: rRNA pseudouridine synthase [Candidatus Salinicoccus stercoripullorum]|uniref:Pseudouridine synthase n=1 Tax=Candidatus Salinicoccus stercoripullorum TaxID=2838756 RepID=A0A9D1QI02_9STAP|nr:rRNA pseudouridine synthase [Candidatus Salinicoccus stercoripullorum]
MRLDKYLSNSGAGSRKDVKAVLKKGGVTVDGKMVKDAKTEVTGEEEILMNGMEVLLERGIYIMLNKPGGVISSTEAGRTATVMDIIDHPQKKDMFPVGRLDKDTTGLLFITDDGQLAHELLSPRKKIGKTYIADLEKDVSDPEIQKLEQGIPLKDFTTAPAEAEKLSARRVKLTITEGKYHQVKRMFGYLENRVTGLRRVGFATLTLDEELAEGSWRRLTTEEVDDLKK